MRAQSNSSGLTATTNRELTAGATKGTKYTQFQKTPVPHVTPTLAPPTPHPAFAATLPARQPTASPCRDETRPPDQRGNWCDDRAPSPATFLPRCIALMSKRYVLGGVYHPLFSGVIPVLLWAILARVEDGKAGLRRGPGWCGGRCGRESRGRMGDGPIRRGAVVGTALGREMGRD